MVGSGVASIFCASALLERGCEVTIFDIAEEFNDESKKNEIKNYLKLKDHQSVSNEVKNFITGSGIRNTGIDYKSYFGSNFTYRKEEKYKDLVNDRVKMFTSGALGGLSNVWGASISPFDAEELKNWPITSQELELAYQDISNIFPIFVSDHHYIFKKNFYNHKIYKFSSGSQANAFFSNNDFSDFKFKIHSGKIALNPDYAGQCIDCGICFQGCPFDVFLNSTQILKKLLLKYPSRLKLKKNCHVEIFEENSDEVKVIYRNMDEIKEEFFNFLYLGAGLVGTAEIVLGSKKLFNRKIPILESRSFIIPALSWRSMKNNYLISNMATFSKVFLESHNLKAGSGKVHLQFYETNELMRYLAKKRLGVLAFPFLINRLCTFLGFLHSSDSNDGTIELVEKHDGKRVVILENFKNQDIQNSLLNEVVNNLKKYSSTFKLMILPFYKFLTFAEGAHLGGTFPMREKPGELETNKNGLLFGHRRVHIIDSSIFPSIPSATIAYTIMANAYRIGKNSIINTHD